jgi:dienelactone hydrolase
MKTLLIFCALFIGAGVSFAAEHPVQKDVRLEELKDLNGYFPFQPPADRGDWEHRSELVRRQMRVALGLWPWPTKTPLNAVVHGGEEREDYRVDKVYFESVPGFFVTGSLYRPLKVEGRVPGVLFAHGHWANGRMMDQGEDTIRREIATGAEHFEEGGRSIMQSMCVGLARMGCVVFHYDMLGYADSKQLSQELVHGFAKQRPEMNTRENWGLFSPQAEAHLQSALGLQAWNSIRAMDFLLGLPEVDPERVACTGASGGGTQTFILAALDDRLKLAFPAVMVSTAMQGGCTCENASLLRVGTGNVEFAALFAPKPQGMTCADDWTREMSTKGFPELQQLYGMYGARDKVALYRGEHFAHNYNSVSRVSFYGFLNRHFRLGLEEPILERDYERLTPAEQTVWDEQHPAPEGGEDFERRLLSSLWLDARDQLSRGAQSPARFRELCGPAMEVVVGRTIAGAGEVRYAAGSEVRHDWGIAMAGELVNESHHEVVPVVFCRPEKSNGRVVLWLSDVGIQGVVKDGTLASGVSDLLAQGFTVCGVDLLYQGRHGLAGLAGQLKETRKVANPREAAAYTFGYNRALVAQRMHDVLTVLAYLRGQSVVPASISAVALDAGVAPVLAGAVAVAGDVLDSVALDTHRFRFGQVLDLRDPSFLPGGAKYGDLPGMLALGGMDRLWITGESPEAFTSLPALTGAKLEVASGAGVPLEHVVAWLKAE